LPAFGKVFPFILVEAVEQTGILRVMAHMLHEAFSILQLIDHTAMRIDNIHASTNFVDLLPIHLRHQKFRHDRILPNEECRREKARLNDHELPA
jgi:hypothetical protein